ncbi:hypothetical protein DFS34DRAFT_290062 [Phlyctochytrium arcticum]|nr:hypothetical protein DFS34DRAFT_290062 [Phlyctochytrium arcticum]
MSVTESTEETKSFYRAFFTDVDDGGVKAKGLQAYCHALATTPHRFSLENLGRIFDCWKNALAENAMSLSRGQVLTNNVRIKYMVPADNDNSVTYSSDLWTHEERWSGKNGLFLNVHMANDGFLYKTLDTLKPMDGDKQDVYRHTKTGDWMRLHLGTYGTAIEPLIAWAKSYLNIKKAKVELFYSFDEERVELKVIDLETCVDGVKFCFEPGPPVSDWDTLDEM